MDWLVQYHETRRRDALETALVAGGFLLGALAVLIFG